MEPSDKVKQAAKRLHTWFSEQDQTEYRYIKWDDLNDSQKQWWYDCATFVLEGI